MVELREIFKYCMLGGSITAFIINIILLSSAVKYSSIMEMMPIVLLPVILYLVIHGWPG
ncbi:MAG: hypothetical protein ACTSRG_10870 [Candidatus Helarchaeota archaeon]